MIKKNQKCEFTYHDSDIFLRIVRYKLRIARKKSELWEHLNCEFIYLFWLFCGIVRKKVKISRKKLKLSLYTYITTFSVAKFWLLWNCEKKSKLRQIQNCEKVWIASLYTYTLDFFAALWDIISELQVKKSELLDVNPQLPFVFIPWRRGASIRFCFKLVERREWSVCLSVCTFS